MWARAAASKPSASQNPPPRFAHLSKGQRVLMEVNLAGKMNQLEGVISEMSSEGCTLQTGPGARHLSVLWKSVLKVTSRGSPRHAAAADSNARLPTDSQIRSGRRSPGDKPERELEKFAFEGGSTDTPLEKFSSEQRFDQLKTLEKMTGQRGGGFKLEDYTTTVDPEISRQNRHLAEAVEAEIKGTKSRHVLQALDRGQKVGEELDEEELYSAVKAKSGAAQAEEQTTSAGSPDPKAADSGNSASPAEPTPDEEEKTSGDADVPSEKSFQEAAPKPEEKKSSAQPKKPAVVSKLRADAPAFIPRSRVLPPQQQAAVVPQVPNEPIYPHQQHPHHSPGLQQQHFLMNPHAHPHHHRPMEFSGVPPFPAPMHPQHAPPPHYVHQQHAPRMPNQHVGYQGHHPYHHHNHHH